MIAKFALVMLLAVATMMSSLINAQADVITAGASGSTTPVQGIVVSMMQYNTTADNMKGKYAPFVYTNTEVATGDTSNLVVIHTNGQSAQAFAWNIIWNFTASESTSIRTWLASQTLRNNLEVRFTATWNAAGRFEVDTTKWTFAFQSLMPYGLDHTTCNVTAQAMQSRGTLGSLPGNCQGALVPGQKQLAAAFPGCLMYFAKTSLDLNNACNTVRSFLEQVYCTDGAAGVDAVCAYNKAFLPSGVAGTTVTTVGADGLPAGGRANQVAPAPGGAAGAVTATAVMAVIVATIAAMI